MKRWIFRSLVFAFALLVGLSAVFLITMTSDCGPFTRIDSKSVLPIEVKIQRPANLRLSGPPIFDENRDYVTKAKVKLLFTGDFHDEEVPYRTGEKWMGLFRNGGNYELKTTTIVVRKIKDDELFDTNVTTNSSGKPIFLLKGDTRLAINSVTTAFDAKDHEDFKIDSCDDIKSSFRIKGMFWRLCMENVPNGYPDKGSYLVLRGPGSETVLRSLPNGCNECTWKLLWAGDLDNDTNLDLLIDVSDHYNVSQPTLFISSQPHVVYASFRGVGC